MNLETISSENLNKEIAYLFGVYLTDGSITSFSDKYGTYFYFSLKAIDEDFVQNTLKSVKNMISSCKANVYEYIPKDREWGDMNKGKISKCQKQYCINVGFTKYRDFFVNQTGNKHHIPYLIWNSSLSIKKWFIAGVMDGDGWISKTERKKYPGQYQYRIGMGGIEEGWIWEFEKFLRELGVKTLKAEIDKKPPRNKPIVRFGIKVESFIEHGLFFTIKRKQDRIKAFIERRSETKRYTS